MWGIGFLLDFYLEVYPECDRRGAAFASGLGSYAASFLKSWDFRTFSEGKLWSWGRSGVFVTLVQIIERPPWIQTKGSTKEAPMCCTRIYDAPVEMSDTSQIIKISLTSLQKKLSSKMDWKTDSTSGAAAVPLQLHGKGLDRSLWKLTLKKTQTSYSKNK